MSLYDDYTPASLTDQVNGLASAIGAEMRIIRDKAVKNQESIQLAQNQIPAKIEEAVNALKEQINPAVLNSAVAGEEGDEALIPAEKIAAMDPEIFNIETILNNVSE